jgi:hypothetical protein
MLQRLSKDYVDFLGIPARVDAIRAETDAIARPAH